MIYNYRNVFIKSLDVNKNIYIKSKRYFRTTMCLYQPKVGEILGSVTCIFKFQKCSNIKDKYNFKKDALKNSNNYKVTSIEHFNKNEKKDLIKVENTNKFEPPYDVINYNVIDFNSYGVNVKNVRSKGSNLNIVNSTLNDDLIEAHLKKLKHCKGLYKLNKGKEVKYYETVFTTKGKITKFFNNTQNKSIIEVELKTLEIVPNTYISEVNEIQENDYNREMFFNINKKNKSQVYYKIYKDQDLNKKMEDSEVIFETLDWNVEESLNNFILNNNTSKVEEDKIIVKNDTILKN